MVASIAAMVSPSPRHCGFSPSAFAIAETGGRRKTVVSGSSPAVAIW
jgi:hypothetical protein